MSGPASQAPESQAAPAGWPDPRPDQRLGRNQRLTHSRYFREAYDQGQCWRGRFMVLWLRAGPDAALRLGVVTSRKVGHAVRRVRARRLLREAYRRHRHLFRGRNDVVLVARSALLTASWDDLVKELLGLADQAGLLGSAEAKKNQT